MSLERAYWRQRKPVAATLPEHKRAEGLIRRLIPTLGPVASVLDVGCGTGRMGVLLAEVLPGAMYCGMDVNPIAVAKAAAAVPNGLIVQHSIQDWATTGEPWDLVIASEVLMHIPPEDIEAVVGKLRELAAWTLITVDWTEPVDGKPSRWNWRHDYEALGLIPYARLGAQTMYVTDS